MKGDDFYKAIVEALERQGVQTSFQSERQLVVACALPYFPESTNSFWLTYQAGYWYLGTWAPRIYQVPQPEELLNVALECLKCSQTAISAVPEAIVSRFSLRQITDLEADQLWGDEK